MASNPTIPIPNFTLLSPDGEDIHWMPSLPDCYQELSLVAATSMLAACSFGDLVFSHYAGEGFDLWKSTFQIHRDARVIGQANQPTLELAFVLDPGLEVNLHGVYAGPLVAQQMELYTAPRIDNRMTFRGGRTCRTLNIHFQPSFLESYARVCPRLEQLLEAAVRQEPARLFGDTVCATPRQAAVLRELAAYSYLDQLAPRYYDSYVHILLVLLLEVIADRPLGDRSLAPREIDLAEEARRLLTADYQASLTIAQLCRKLGTNPFTLKTTFKRLFGISIGKYKKAAFMDYARQLLLDTDQTIDEIAMQLGYNSQQSFTTAFRNHFGYTPGWVRTGRKK